MSESKPKGFRAMSDLQRKEIASQGGKAAHQLGRAHKWDSEKARLAGLKGAESRKRKAEERAALQRQNAVQAAD